MTDSQFIETAWSASFPRLMKTNTPVGAQISLAPFFAAKLPAHYAWCGVSIPPPSFSQFSWLIFSVFHLLYHSKYHPSLHLITPWLPGWSRFWAHSKLNTRHLLQFAVIVLSCTPSEGLWPSACPFLYQSQARAARRHCQDFAWQEARSEVTQCSSLWQVLATPYQDARGAIRRVWATRIRPEDAMLRIGGALQRDYWCSLRLNRYSRLPHSSLQHRKGFCYVHMRKTGACRWDSSRFSGAQRWRKIEDYGDIRYKILISSLAT